jgi:hypothetical protein
MLFILAIDPLQKILDMATTAGLLTPIGVDPIKMRTSLYAAGLLTPIGVGLIKMRTSLYADNAMLFMRPTSSDVANLRELLIHFGEAMGLHANTHKSEVFPIRCEGLDISRIVEQMQVKQGSLPCKYLGLPLRLGRIRREDEQVLVDKVAGKLPKWKGKLLNKSRKLILVNSVLSSVVLYHMTVFPLSK